MGLYRYAAFASNGRIERGELEARSAEEVATFLVSRGLTPFETVACPAASFLGGKPSTKKLSSVDLASFMREFATLLEAELPIDDTLSVLSESRARSRGRSLAITLLGEVRTGVSLSDAFERHASGSPMFVASLIRAGEARGALGATVSEIARYLESRADVEARIRSAVTYPLVLLAIAAATLAIVFTYLFPALLKLFEDSGLKPPFVLAFAREMTAMIETNGLWFAIMVILFLGLIIYSLRKMGSRHALDRLWLSLPIIRGIWTTSSAAILARTLGLLIRNGVPIIAALEVTSRVIPSYGLAQTTLVAMGKVREGQRLSEGFAHGGALPEIAVRLIAVGEATGKLDTMLLHCADMLERDTARAIEHAITMLSPAITIAVGLLIGGIVLSVMEAIMSVNSLAVS